MQLLKLKIGDKTYMSGKITTYLTKEAIRIQKDALAYAEAAKGMDQTDINAASDLLDGLLELQDRKVWLLCEAYGNKFTPDDVERNLAQDEVDLAVNQIIYSTGAAIEKN